MIESCFPPGTTVRVRQTVDKRSAPFTTDVVGDVEGWEDQPTGSWYAHHPAGLLKLRRLKLRKKDGELALLIVDDSTEITRAEEPGS